MQNRVTYSSPKPEGAGAGYKVDRVPAPRVGGNCFAAMQSVSELDMMCSQAPSEHQQIITRLKQMGKVRAKNRPQASDPEDHIGVEVIPTPRPAVRAKAMGFGLGAMVKDVKTGRKGIIIHANAGYTAKTHKPVHRVSDSDGNSWYAKQSHLKLIY